MIWKRENQDWRQGDEAAAGEAGVMPIVLSPILNRLSALSQILKRRLEEYDNGNREERESLEVTGRVQRDLFVNRSIKQ